MYAHTTFAVRTRSGLSEVHQQHSGIRQGCPLSPYLFVIFMSVLMDDVENTYTQHHPPSRVHTAADPLFDLEYADDVLLLTKTREQMQTLVRLIEEGAALYGMKLNPDKVKMISMNAPVYLQPILLRSGSEVEQVSSWPYLGVRVARDGRQTVNLSARLAQATQGFNKLTSFWAHAGIPT